MKRIIAFILVLCLTLPLLCSCDKVSKTPAEALNYAMDVSSENLKSNNYTKVLTDAADGGSVEISMDLTGLMGFITGMELENKLGLTAKSYSAKNGETQTSVLGILVDGKAMVEANLFSDSEKLIMTSEELLGSKAYGATLEAITELLESAGITEAVFQNSANIGVAEKLTEVVTKYYKLFFDTLFDTCPAERTKNSIAIGDEAAEAVSFKMNLTAAQTAEVLRTVYNAFMADADAKKIVDEYLASTGLSSSGIDLYSDLEQAITELEEEGANSKDSIDVRLDFNADAGNLMQIYITPVGSDNENESLALILGADPENPKYSAFIFKDEDETLSLEMKTVEDTKDKLKKEFTIQSDSTTTATLDYDKASGSYTLEINLPENLADSMMLPVDGKATASVTGEYKSTKDSLTFSIDSISANMGTAISFNLDLSAKLVVLAKDSGAPTAPESYEDLTQESVQTELINELNTNLVEIVELLPEGLLELFY